MSAEAGAEGLSQPAELSGARKAALARELLLLDMLADRVAEQNRLRRDELAELGVPKDSFPETVPNDDDPESPHLAGTVRVDGGNVTVRVHDERAFHAWVRASYPDKLIEQPAGTTARSVPSADEAAALRSLWSHARQGDPWAEEPHLELWHLLGLAGFQLARIVPVPARAVVDHAFMESLTKALKKHAGEDGEVGRVDPVDARGLTVDGVVVTRAVNKVVVTPSKDRATVDRFVRDKRGVALLALVPPSEED